MKEEFLEGTALEGTIFICLICPGLGVEEQEVPMAGAGMRWD